MGSIENIQGEKRKDKYLTSREHLNTEHSDTIPNIFHRVANRIACWRLEARISAMKHDPDSVRNRIGMLGYSLANL